MSNKNYLYIGGGILAVLLLIAGYSLLRGGTTTGGTTGGGGFGTGENRDITITSPTGTSSNPEGQGVTYSSGGTARIFEVNSGPVMSATLMEYGRPTTTVARFVMQDSGHVFDLPLDSPGAVARAVSNTTIPGLSTATWSESGNGAILQYIDNNTIKTLHLAFPPATTTITTSGPVKIQFLPDNIAQVAVSPTGQSVGYLVSTAAGADGYTAKPDGSGGKKLFSLPLSQLLLSWPAAHTLLAQTTSAAGVPGVVFSIDASTGDVVPLIYAQGLTATSDKNFGHVLYQTTTAGVRSTYARDVKTGSNVSLSFDPFPEKCASSNIASSVVYCAAPLTYVAPSFLDGWHQGTASAADSIFMFNVATGQSQIVAAPGGPDGGQQADIDTLAVSPDDHYVLFIRKGDRSLWGVRLTQ